MVDLKYHGCLDTKYILCRLSKMCVCSWPEKDNKLHRVRATAQS